MREMSGTISDKYFAMGIKNPCLKLTFDNKKNAGAFPGYGYADPPLWIF